MWSVTFEVWADEDIEAGDTDERGFICENVSLRSAVAEFFDGTSKYSDGSEVTASAYPVETSRWISITDTDYIDGTTNIRAIHFPAWVSGPSRKRLYRILSA